MGLEALVKVQENGDQIGGNDEEMDIMNMNHNNDDAMDMNSPQDAGLLKQRRLKMT